jgi:hypothetical protein
MHASGDFFDGTSVAKTTKIKAEAGLIYGKFNDKINACIYRMYAAQ